MKRPDAATISAQSTCWYRDTVRSCQRMIRLISATQAVRSSRSFHRIASPPPGFSTRAISANAASASNQWKAWATVTTSTDASGSGIASAVPSTTWAVRDGRTRLLAHALDGFDGGDGRRRARRGAG